MSKKSNKTTFYCSECGYESTKWLGQCPSCNAWNTFVEAEKIDKNQVKITKHDNIYFVEAKWLFNIMKSVNFDDYESLQYFQRVLINGGVIDALREAGINEGDTVSIYELEFDFVE